MSTEPTAAELTQGEQLIDMILQDVSRLGSFYGTGKDRKLCIVAQTRYQMRNDIAQALAAHRYALTEPTPERVARISGIMWPAWRPTTPNSDAMARAVLCALREETGGPA